MSFDSCLHLVKIINPMQPEYDDGYYHTCIEKTVIFPLFFHFMSASENSVIVCSPSCCSKPSFFYGTQKEMLERTTSSQSPLIFFLHIMKVNHDWRKEVMQVWSNMRVTDNMVYVDCPHGLSSEDHLYSAVRGPEALCWSDLVDLVSRHQQNN